MRKICGLFLTLVLLSTTGCLKTRAQLKEDGDDSAEAGTTQAAPAKVQDVQPQGQYVIDELKSEITRLEGRIEDLERAQKAGAATDKQQDTKKLEDRIIELEQAQASMLEAIKKMQTSLPVQESPELFDQARAQFGQGKFEDAIASLDGYLKATGAAHTEEATFLRGESYYNLKQYKKAIVDYSKFPEKFTKSKRMAAALYKIGMSFEALGMKDDAQGFYQELVDKYPKSPEAKKAKRKLK